MKLTQLLPLLIILVTCGCRHEQHDKTGKQGGSVKADTHSQQSDTLVVDHRTGVEVQLDSAALVENRKKYGDTSVDAYTEDGAYYQSTADSVLRQKKLPVIQSLHYKFIKFVQNNGRTTVVKVDTLPAVSTLFFFDPAKPPHEVDVTDIENEYKKFYLR